MQHPASSCTSAWNTCSRTCERAHLLGTTTHFTQSCLSWSCSQNLGPQKNKLWLAKADPNFIGYTYKNWEAVQPNDGGALVGTGMLACFGRGRSEAEVAHEISEAAAPGRSQNEHPLGMLLTP